MLAGVLQLVTFAEPGLDDGTPQFDGQCLEYLLAFFEKARRAYEQSAIPLVDSLG